MSTATWFDPAFRQTLVRFARRRVPADDVEDVVQEALCDVLGSGCGRSRTEMLRCSLVILRRRIVDTYRVRQRAPVESADSEIAEAAAAHHPDPSLEARDCLQRLDFSHAAMGLILGESAGDSFEQLARETGLTPEAARQRVSRHRRHLRTWLAAAAMFSLLLVAGAWRRTPSTIVAEPMGAVVAGALEAFEGSYLVQDVEPDETLGSVDRELARTLQGRTVRLDRGVVWLGERSLLTLDALTAGALRGHDGHGVVYTMYVRSDADQLRLEAWSGRFRGRVTLTRVP